MAAADARVAASARTVQMEAADAHDAGLYAGLFGALMLGACFLTGASRWELLMLMMGLLSPVQMGAADAHDAGLYSARHHRVGAADAHDASKFCPARPDGSC